ncbi:hypothetical protein ACD578_29255 (plasmid) [Microvirga sp. RSM25]|uniref:hypothetical protein n=1 Tax=Microvirga sp. RSM25 TaxID=3273802 RepID=UPI00384B95BC
MIITAKLASYPVAKRAVIEGLEHRQHRGLNNRAENSHQPTDDGSASWSASSPPRRPLLPAECRDPFDPSLARTAR